MIGHSDTNFNFEEAKPHSQNYLAFSLYESKLVGNFIMQPLEIKNYS